MTGARPRTVYAVTARGRERAAAVARRAAGAADARVRGNGQGLLRRRRDVGAAAGDADLDRRDGRCTRSPSSRRRSSRTSRARRRRFPNGSRSTRSDSGSSVDHERLDRRLGTMGARPDRRLALDHRPRRVGLPPHVVLERGARDEVGGGVTECRAIAVIESTNASSASRNGHVAEVVEPAERRRLRERGGPGRSWFQMYRRFRDAAAFQ